MKKSRRDIMYKTLAETHVLGTGRLQFRHSGKHLVLVQGKRDRVKRLCTQELIGQEVVLTASLFRKSKKA